MMIKTIRTSAAVFLLRQRLRYSGYEHFERSLNINRTLRTFSTSERVDNDDNRAAFGKFKLAESLASIVDETSAKVHNDDNRAAIGTFNLAESLASIVDDSFQVEENKPRSRIDVKRFHELCIKKRVKEQYVSGKFQNLMKNAIANPKTLEDAYCCNLLSSKVDISSAVGDNIDFESVAAELSDGSFNVGVNTFSISTRGASKEVMVLPNFKLKVVQEAMRIVLEVVYRPQFSKISHGGRPGRGHSSALKYICKDISDPDWWFTIHLCKKVDGDVLDKLFLIMEERIRDPELFNLIRKMFDVQVLNLEFGGFPKGHGLPQEGVLSPILMNIYLDAFDREFYKMSMRYEVLGSCPQVVENESQSKLRSWFRRQLKEKNVICADEEKSAVRLYACRFMDEIFLAVSGSKEAAFSLKSEVQNYLQGFLHLDFGDDVEVIPCNGAHGIRFLGALVKRTAKENPATKSVHKLKEKVQMFASHKQDVWDDGMVKIGMKCLGHGLKKVKESEIKQLADSSSLLSKISSFRKPGMETDHWYKQLLKIWMQDAKVRTVASEEYILSKYIAEPSVPVELRDSFYEFQRRAQEFLSSETNSLHTLLPGPDSSYQTEMTTAVIAPVEVIKKRLVRYGLATVEGYARPSYHLVLLDNIQIIDWFAGVVHRWLRWYSNTGNFAELKLIISDQLRKSCIRTLASKYKTHEDIIEKRFGTELSRIPSTLEFEHEMGDEMLDSCRSDSDMTLTYGVSYSGLCLLSLARMTTKSRPCSCFVMGCSAPAPSVYTLHVMERQKFPGWKTGFSSCIHPSLNKRRIGFCEQHLSELCHGNISLQSINFGAWSREEFLDRK